MIKSSRNMFYVTVLLLSLLETQNTVNGGPAPQYFISTPQNTTVTAGHRARLSCSVGNMVGSCQWTKDGLSVDGVSRYQLHADISGLCDLTIDPVLTLDEGVYQCQVSGGRGVAPISSAPVSLSVNSEPGQPYIVQAMEDGVMEVKEGEEVELQCESQGGRPPAEIQWWDGEGRRIVSDVTEHVRRMEDRKTFKTVSTLKFKPLARQKIKCSAHNDAFLEGKVSDYLEIVFSGQPKVEVKTLEDGDSVKIFCNNENTFGDMNFKWFINDVEIFDETKSFLEIQQFSKSYDKSKVKCSVKDKMNNDVVIRDVELVYKQKVRESKALPRTFREITNRESSSGRKKEFPKTNGNKKQTMFTCIVEEDIAIELKYVWIDGKLRDMTTDGTVEATDQNRKYKCKVIPRGMKKIKKMSKDLKTLNKLMKKMSKSLVEMTLPTGTN